MSMGVSKVTGHVVDIAGRRTFAAEITISDGRIASIEPVDDPSTGDPSTGDITASGTPETFLLPGFIDAHVHIESSMLVPTEFARDGRNGQRSARNWQCLGRGRGRVHARQREPLSAEVLFWCTFLRARDYF